MSDNFIKKVSSINAHKVVKNSIENGELGIGVWNLTKEEFLVIEKITERNRMAYQSLFEFIQVHADPRDTDMVLRNLEIYMDNPSKDFRSTFRIRSNKDVPKWLLLKGTKLKNGKLGETVFNFVLHDVSGDKFETGHDKRTNLLDRNFFVKKIKFALSHQKPNEKTGIIRVGINNYREIKDIYGLQVIDELINKTAKRLNEIFSGQSELARFTNETFIAMVPDYKKKQNLVNLTEKIIEVFQKPLQIENNIVRVKVSIGVTTFPDQCKSVEEILLHSEYATQQSRQQGDYVTTFFNERLADALHTENILVNDLPDALESKNIYTVYQPQIEIESGRVIGIEALARWNHPSLGPISPGVFIPMAERNGLMLALGRKILDVSIRQAKQWQHKGYVFDSLAINVSPIELLNENFVPHLLKTCEKYNFEPSKLEIEITEGIDLRSIGESEAVICELLAHDFRIAVDDFGSGYANLSFVSSHSLHTLKIDKSLIDRIKEETTGKMLEGIIAIARSLNYEVVAEGVEEEEQMERLKKMNCSIIQGYYSSKPLPADEMEAFLKEKNG